MSKKLLAPGDARNLCDFGYSPDSVDCFITSPPYFNLKRYDEGAVAELGQGQALDDYLEDLGGILESCFTLAKPTGVLWLVVDTLRTPSASGGLGQLEPLPFRISDVAQRSGWRLQEVVIWEKNKTLPYSGQGKLRISLSTFCCSRRASSSSIGRFAYLTVTAPRPSGLPGGQSATTRSVSDQQIYGRFRSPRRVLGLTQRGSIFVPLPQELVARCIELTTDKGDLVLDPFAGIGTVPAQAEAMGRGVGVSSSNEASSRYSNNGSFLTFRQHGRVKRRSGSWGESTKRKRRSE